jgi:hypothetical protein
MKTLYSISFVRVSTGDQRAGQRFSVSRLQAAIRRRILTTGQDSSRRAPSGRQKVLTAVN